LKCAQRPERSWRIADAFQDFKSYFATLGNHGRAGPEAALSARQEASYLRSMNKKHLIAVDVAGFVGLACVLLVAISVLGHTVAMPPV